LGGFQGATEGNIKFEVAGFGGRSEKNTNIIILYSLNVMHRWDKKCTQNLF
jgi:hypothetical protein